MAELVGVKPRVYQETILASCATGNTMVVLPTGLGKTAVAMMMAVQRLSQYPKSKILLLAPTKPLAEQHVNTFTEHLALGEDQLITLLTGSVSPKKRAKLWEESTVIISTPQGIENDVINGRINLKDVSLIIFDEAHRAVGNYAYTFIAAQYNKHARHERILALTASPGSNMEGIMDVCENLHIEEVEIRTEKDPDVAPYVQKTDVKYVEIPLPSEFSDVLKVLKDCYHGKLKEAREFGYVSFKNVQDIGKRQLLGMLSGLQGQVAQGEGGFEVFKSISVVSEALKVEHAIELLETQGIGPACDYMTRLQQESYTTKVKAVINLVRDVHFKTALIKLQSLSAKGLVHPKVPMVLGMVDETLEKDPHSKIILFTNYRDTGAQLVEKLKLVNGVRAKQFVGQAKKKSGGLSQKEQKEILQEFRNGTYNVLVATSVAEEGLDIPQVHQVIFYEPIPSSIRSIQRRGRTGRLEHGQVQVLLTKGTRDIGYRWSAHHKEKRMYRVLEELRTKLKHKMQGRKSTSGNANLETFLADNPLHVFVDDREKGSTILKDMVNMGIQVHVQRLDCGDYIISNRCGIEFKTVHDFVQSIVDGRLLEQLRDLKNTYDRPVLMIEGEEDIYSVRNIHPNAIRGMLSMITVSYGIPVLRTKNNKDTASTLAIMAKREQSEDPRAYLPRMAEKRSMPLHRQQESLVATLPGIGATLAAPLLKEFGSVFKLVNATKDDLKKVELIGEKKADTIRTLLDAEYQG